MVKYTDYRILNVILIKDGFLSEKIVFSHWGGVYTIKSMDNYEKNINRFKKKCFTQIRKS